MLASFTSYKKPLTKEDEKEEFDALYQLLQSMVKPSEVPSSPSQEKNEVINPLIIKENDFKSKEESKVEQTTPILSPILSEISPSDSIMIKEEKSLENDMTASLDVFEIYKYIRPRGRPKGSKTTTEKNKKEKRKYTKKDRQEKSYEKEVQQDQEETESNASEETVQPIVHPIEMPKSMKVPVPRIPVHPNSIICKSCLGSFPKNTDYLFHLNTSDICMKILVQPLYYQPRHELTKPLHMSMYDWLSSALTDGKDLLRCRHCHMDFKSIGNMNKHLYTSLTCNRMAYIEFKKIVSDY